MRQKLVLPDEATTTREGQPTVTVKEELEQMLEAAQAEEEDEHSEEWLNIFSQEAEKTAALKLAAGEKKKKQTT
jgi:ABC-type branched-subunit amino acid transport system ATPase component